MVALMGPIFYHGVLFLTSIDRKAPCSMLDFLRKRKRNWIIIFFLGVIIVVFALFYGGNKPHDQGLTQVAEINGEIISQRDFVVQYQRAVDRYREMLKGSLTPEMIKGL